MGGGKGVCDASLNLPKKEGGGCGRWLGEGMGRGKRFRIRKG